MLYYVMNKNAISPGCNSILFTACLFYFISKCLGFFLYILRYQKMYLTAWIYFGITDAHVIVSVT